MKNLFLLIFFFFFAGNIYAAEDGRIESNSSKIIAYPPKVLVYPSGNPVVLLNEDVNTISFVDQIDIIPSGGTSLTKDLEVDQILLNGIDITRFVKAVPSTTYEHDPFNNIKFYLKSFKFDPSTSAGVLPPGEYEFTIKATTGLSGTKQTKIESKVKIIVDQLKKK